MLMISFFVIYRNFPIFEWLDSLFRSKTSVLYDTMLHC